MHTSDFQHVILYDILVLASPGWLSVTQLTIDRCSCVTVSVGCCEPRKGKRSNTKD